MKRKIRKLLSVVLAGVLTVMTAGCSDIKTMIDTALTAQGSTKNWYYSDIEGQLRADITIREQDDFHAAVNRDWILSQKPEEEGGVVIDLLSGEKEMERQMRVLLRDPDSTGYRSNSSVGMSAEEVAHAGELVAAFAEEAGNTEKRTALGAEPLRPYVETVMKIRSLSELSRFITESDRNIPGAPLIDITVGATKTDPETYRLIASPMNEGYLTLETPASYEWIDAGAIISKQKKSEITRLVLGELGWSAGEINGILARCYRLECRLAKHMLRQGAIEADDYEEKYCREMPIDEADALLGDYPLAGFLRANSLDQNGLVTVYQPDYMEELSSIYCEENLEELKAFYVVNTVYAGCDLLDPGTAEAVSKILTRGGEETENPKETGDPDSEAPMELGNDSGLSEEDKKTDAIINNYIRQYLSAPFDMMYIAAYLSGDEKDALREMTHTVKAEFRNILAAEEWMSEESRVRCVEKLDAMAERILFPDEYISCLPLQFTGDENLVDMVQSIFSYNRMRRASLIGTERTRNEWDLFECPTTVANAFNAITENAIILPAGITAGGFTFNMSAPYERNLAGIGTILGHEITHGFDDTGTRYDRNGTKYSYDHIDDLMTAEDRSEFSSRTYRLTAWYAAQSPVPGSESYVAPISGEAIADMGGMKCALFSAAHTEGFDYDLFFRSYAKLWRKVCTEETERLYAQMDPHPLAFFRTNVTLQQFDEFIKTYGIQEGDGMYLSPENRIIIW